MSKRTRGPKRSHLKRFSANNINAYQGPNPAKLAEYHATVKSVTGPKNNLEPVLENSFTRPILDGVPGKLRCTCGKGPFWTTVSFDLHIKSITKGEMANHASVFEPELKKGHVDLDGVYRPHRFIDTPKKEKEHNLKVWQSRTRQGFDEWRWFYVTHGRNYRIELGFMGAVWKFKKEEHEVTTYSIGYNSKEQAMLYFDSVLIQWLKSPSMRKSWLR